MATEIGQTSRTHPAALQDGQGMWHLLFQSEDFSNRLLYVTSDDGGAGWAMGPGTGQTTSAPPAIALVPPNLLVAVFIANDTSWRVLYSVLDLNERPDLRAWRLGGK